MLKMPFRYFRSWITFGGIVVLLSIAGPMVFPSDAAGIFFSILFWSVLGVSLVSGIPVAVLQMTGRLEFTYTSADRSSYLYNAKTLHRQMRSQRCAKRRD